MMFECREKLQLFKILSPPSGPSNNYSLITFTLHHLESSSPSPSVFSRPGYESPFGCERSQVQILDEPSVSPLPFVSCVDHVMWQSQSAVRLILLLLLTGNQEDKRWSHDLGQENTGVLTVLMRSCPLSPPGGVK